MGSKLTGLVALLLLAFGIYEIADTFGFANAFLTDLSVALSKMQQGVMSALQTVKIDTLEKYAKFVWAILSIIAVFIILALRNKVHELQSPKKP